MLHEKFRNALSSLGSLVARSADTSKKQEFEEFQQADWDNPIACQLEELLTNNLLATFRSAIKQIAECGYTEEAAEWAVLNSGLYHGIKDAVSNVVDGALALLTEKEFNTSNRPLFGGLQNLVDYTILEMIHVLREVRPALTIAEAMWYLLISDLNLVNACVMEGVISGSPCVPESPGESSVATISQSKDGVSVNSHLGSKTCDDPRQLTPCARSFLLESPISVPVHRFPNSRHRAGELANIVKEGSVAPHEVKGKFSAITKEQIQTSSQSMSVDVRSGGSKKGPSGSSKRDLLRHKTFQFEKSYKGRMSKGAFKAKVAAWGNMMLDKSSKSQSGSSSVVMKGTYSKVTGIKDALVQGKHHLSSNSQHDGPAGVLPVKDPVFSLPAVISKSSASLVPDPNSLLNGEQYVSGSHKSTDYFAAIPYDETLQKYAPQDDKGETILILVPHKKALERELQGWTHWANDKVMQAARRLGSDQGELKLLRQEKEETEKLNKERQTLEENTLKRLSEMENALSNASGHIEMANSAIRRLGEKNSLLKKKMEDDKSQALRAASNLQEAVKREQDTLKKSQLWNAEKGLIQEQLTDLKRQVADLNCRLEKAQVQVDQFKVLMRHEEKEKIKAAKYIDSLRLKKEEDAVTKEEEDKIKQMGELNLQKCKVANKNLESEISELRLESDKSKIAALNVGYGSCLTGGEVASTFPGFQLPKITKQLAVFQENFGAVSVGLERDCIMCMTEEISVVFLPCAHQVLCRQCSNLHEKQGMNDCPSCRTTIDKRIYVGYRVN